VSANLRAGDGGKEGHGGAVRAEAGHGYDGADGGHLNIGPGNYSAGNGGEGGNGGDLIFGAGDAKSISALPTIHNTLNIGTFNGGAIQQGTSHSTQVTGHAGSLSGMDLTKLAVEFASLRAAALPQASSPEHFSAIGRLSEAQIGAEANDASKVQQALSSLGQAGRWLLSTSEKIGIGLATAALKTHLNL